MKEFKDFARVPEGDLALRRGPSTRWARAASELNGDIADWILEALPKGEAAGHNCMVVVPVR
jgi:hypothetical protein